MTKDEEAKTLARALLGQEFIGFICGKAVWADCDEFYAGKIRRVIQGLFPAAKNYYVKAGDGLFEVREYLSQNVLSRSASRADAEKVAEALNAKEVRP